jgi:hypothetical protein
MVFLTTMLTTADVNIHTSNRQIWYRHPNKENTKVRPEMTKFKMSREKVNMDFYFVGIRLGSLVIVIMSFYVFFICNLFFAPL